ncbi:MAG: hypothetical protein KF902_09100 [Phycisphaeraceae bacterium]|nr:hypothetical protein [Phycisphaeraceae bacterium]
MQARSKSKAMRLVRSLCGFAGVCVLISGHAAGQATPGENVGSQGISQNVGPEVPQLHFLVINDQHLPRVRVEWEGAGSKPVVIERELEYTAPAMRTDVGHNLEVFVALGGARLDRQAGHPDGAIVRVGLYKVDAAKPFFEGLERDSLIEVKVTNVVFDKPAVARRESGVQHIKYSPEGLAECGLSGAAFELYNTADPSDNLNGSITDENGRMGALVGGDSEFTVTQEPDGSYTMVARIRYSMLRHILDPWQLTKPGTFLEPVHFHLEFEAIPQLHVPESLRPIPLAE